MKQSSIEFAVTSLEKLIPSGNQLVIGAILEQAKAMHKEEIENAYWDGGQWVPTSGSQCEEYYNETFNTNQENLQDSTNGSTYYPQEYKTVFNTKKK